MKKSNNPFKMIESWIGVILGPIIGAMLLSLFVDCNKGMCDTMGLAVIYWIIVAPLFAIGGFFLGWLIHKKLRRYY